MKIVIVLLVVTVLSLTTAQLATVTTLLNFANLQNLFNGPIAISSGPLRSPVNSKRPTSEQISYYSHYGAVNCPVSSLNFNCAGCKIIKNNIDSYKIINSNTGQRVLLTVSSKLQEIVASFRGTVNPLDVILDLLFINGTPDPNSNIKVHRGFYIATMSLYSQVIAAVTCQLNKNPTFKVVLTGLSLGAAMARMTQFFIHYNNQFADDKIEVYTYGEPRSGNMDYVDFLNGRNTVTARVVNKADLIPHLPPTSILNSTFLYDFYAHVQFEFWFKSLTETVICDDTNYEDKDCSNSLDPAYSISDHFDYSGSSSSQCMSDALNLFSPVNLLSTVTALPDLPKYLQIPATVDCGFTDHLWLLNLL